MFGSWYNNGLKEIERKFKVFQFKFIYLTIRNISLNVLNFFNLNILLLIFVNLNENLWNYVITLIYFFFNFHQFRWKILIEGLNWNFLKFRRVNCPFLNFVVSRVWSKFFLKYFVTPVAYHSLIRPQWWSNGELISWRKCILPL